MDFEFKQPLLKDLQDRGFIHSATSPQTLEDAVAKKAPVYCGFDCTADSLHVGSLMALTMMKKFHEAGHKIIAVIGTSTTLVGDPSGKDETRPLITEEQVLKNARGIVASIEAVIGKQPLENFEIQFNSAWLKDINWLDFLRDFGAHISVSNMLRLDSVNSRLANEEGMSFLEFNYSLFQAMDFVKLAEQNDNLIQIGGSDQWGNITMGTELVRRKLDKEVWGITTPLLMNSDGEKMGKTAKGAVWLNPDQLSDFDFWQFWRSVDDEAVFRFMKLFSPMNLVAINAIEAKHDITSINNMKKALATAVTSTVRGTESAMKAQHTAEELFERGQTSAGMPTFELRASMLGKEVARLVKEAEMANSLTAARNLINQGGVRINDVKIEVGTILSNDHFTDGQMKLSVGKKKHKLINLVGE